MLFFVIPLKARRYSGDWFETCFLLQRTLQSLETQGSDRHRALIVCNDAPEIAHNRERTTVLPTDVGADEPGGGLTRGRLDLVRKRYYGLTQARAMGARHVMFLDADDLLHRDLVAAVEAGADRDTFVINRGYRYVVGEDRLRRSYFFNEICASYAIFPEVMYRDLSDYGPWAHESFELTRTNHVKDAERYFRCRDLSCRHVPFFAGIYVRGHSQSLRDEAAREAVGGPVSAARRLRRRRRQLVRYSKKAVGWVTGSRRIDDAVLAEFGGLSEHVARAAGQASP